MKKANFLWFMSLIMAIVAIFGAISRNIWLGGSSLLLVMIFGLWAINEEDKELKP